MASNEKHNQAEIIKKMNALLSAYQVAYFNARSSHWMIRGENFFELHKVFEVAYNDGTVKIDDIAERILTLGGLPLMDVNEMLDLSQIKLNRIKGDQTECVKGMLEDLNKLTVLENEIIKMSQDAQDVVTADILTKYLGEQQKTSWMLYQFLKKKSEIK